MVQLIQKYLKYISIHFRHDKADEFPIYRPNRTDHISFDMLASKRKNRTAPTFCPNMSWAAISHNATFVLIPDFEIFPTQQFAQSLSELTALVLVLVKWPTSWAQTLIAHFTKRITGMRVAQLDLEFFLCIRG